MKKELAFILTMAGLMCCGMCSFNLIFIHGFSNDFMSLLLTRWLSELVVATLLVYFVVRHIMRRVASLCAFISNSFLKFSFILPLCNVLIMAPLMSLAALLLFGYGDAGFKSAYVAALLRNYPAAALLQICLVGPIVRHLFRQRPQPSLPAAA